MTEINAMTERPRMFRNVPMGQTLLNMRGLSVIALISVIPELSTKALFVLGKL